ncbi:MAG: M24 family metallopeptidase [Aquabacterium sp.]
MDTRVNPVRERIESVRQALQRHGAHALLVPSADPHLSEYLPERWQGRVWLTGFDGSVATLVITLRGAALFADSRYWEQAAAQLQGSGVELVRVPNVSPVHHQEWLARELKAGDRLLADAQVLGLAQAAALSQAMVAAGIELHTDVDLLQEVWTNRPTLPVSTVRPHVAPQATESRTARLARIREAMAAHGASHHFISSVDDVAWLTNLRGNDVDYNPVFLAHLLIDATSATMFVGAGKIDATLAATLTADGFTLADYAGAAAALGALPADAVLLLDPKRVTLGFRHAVRSGVRVVEAINPSTLAKSRKSAAEAAYIRQAMAEDGAAMCRFYAWFEQAQGRERITELTIDEKLSAERARGRDFVGLSFSTIAGFNANGALPHYRATPAAHAVIEGNGLLLIDSGGQYLGGTTDITRVWPIGTITAAQRRDFTLVLKATMSLSRTRFPRGTPGPMLDAIARAPLWSEGIDFGHGTGHGVGYFLAVHEGPQTISKTTPEPTMAMEPGMITSIEPGVYRPGQWGVRIENLVLNQPATTPENGGFGEMLEFETLTLCPIDTRCIDRTLMRPDEIDWLNAYHATVRERLSPLVTGDALAWLQARTEPI